jgi:hypothetical protein
MTDLTQTILDMAYDGGDYRTLLAEWAKLNPAHQAETIAIFNQIDAALAVSDSARQTTKVILANRMTWQLMRTMGAKP